MIIIKIPVEVNIYKLEVIIHGLKTYLMLQADAFTNGKTAGDRYDTMKYQIALKLADKLLRKLTDKKLNPAKKDRFKIKLLYHEALVLMNVLQDITMANTDDQVAANHIIAQLDKNL